MKYIIILLMALFPLSSFCFGAEESDSHALKDQRIWNIRGKMYPGRIIQDRIDQAYLKIFSSTTGKIFCEVFLPGDYSSIQKVTDTSVSTAKDIADVCRPFANKSSAPAKPLNARVKLYLFISPESALEGWSDLNGNTYLFFKDIKDISQYALISKLTHELAIRLDFIELIRLVTYRQIERNLSIDGAVLQYKPQDICRVVSIMTNTPLQLHFRAMRARALESDVLENIYGHPLPAVSSANSSCNSGFIETLPATLDVYHKFGFSAGESLGDQTYRRTSEANSCPLEDLSTRLIKDMIHLQNESVLVSRKIKVNLCELFRMPLLYSPDEFFHSGPGPRIGGGWKPEDLRTKMKLHEDLTRLKKSPGDTKTSKSAIESLQKIMNKPVGNPAR